MLTMNDYYSQYLGPNKSQAIDELSNYFKLETNSDSEWLHKIIVDSITKEFELFGGLGSQTGWYVAVKPAIIKEVKRKQHHHERSQKLLLKLFYHFKVFAVFLKLYRDIYFKPNGEYMKSIQQNYKKYF